MKVTREESFKPVTIVLETQEEVALVYLLSGKNYSVAKEVYRHEAGSYSELSKLLSKIYSALGKVK